MKFTIACIGKTQKKWIKDGISEYVKRLAPIAKVQIVELEEEKPPANWSEAVKDSLLEKEGEKLLKYVRKSDYVILLDVSGKEVSSLEAASLIQKQMLDGISNFVFLIGGPFGNGKNVRAHANFCLSLSPMTFTHQMARLILVEQLYRSMKIIRNEPYHL